MLAVIFSGRHEVVKEPRDDRVFIDRDPDTFKHVISFLRLGAKWVAPTDDPIFINRLKVEFDFFDLPFPLTKEERRKVKMAKAGFVRAGTLLTPKLTKLLNGWVGTSTVQQDWTLLYQATRDGFEANTFHNMCDGQGPTLVVLRSNGFLFGGFSPAPWSKSGAYVSNASTFLFTLTNPHNIQPTKFPASGAPNHIYCHGGYGPTFGSGHDLQNFCTKWLRESCDSSYLQLPQFLL